MSVSLILLGLITQATDGVREGEAKNGVSYCVRLPKSYTPRLGAPVLVWLHGSNMNSINYVKTFMSMKWLPDWILIGIDGETGSREKGHNYTFRSAKFIADAYDEITAKLRITRAFIGGHSQGGYVTYSVVMEYPGKFAGAISVSGGLWIQCQPNRYKDDVREKQKKTAFAIVHGRADPVVGFSLAEGAHFSYLDVGFPMVRLYDPEKGDHRFALLPVKDAIEWCHSMTEPDRRKLAGYGLVMLKEKRYRAASAAALTARSGTLARKVESLAARAVKPLARQMAKGGGDSWVRDFWAFRREFGLTQAGRPLLDAYAKLRKEQEKPAEELFWSARRDFQGNDDEAAYKKYEKIVAEHYASRWYFYAKRSLESRK